MIDTATDKVVATLPCGKLPIRAAFTPDGARVLVSDPVGGEVVIFDARSRAVVARVPVLGGAMALAMAPDSKRAFVVEIEAGRVVAIDLEKNAVEPAPLIGYFFRARSARRSVRGKETLPWRQALRRAPRDASTKNASAHLSCRSWTGRCRFWTGGKNHGGSARGACRGA